MTEQEPKPRSVLDRGVKEVRHRRYNSMGSAFYLSLLGGFAGLGFAFGAAVESYSPDRELEDRNPIVEFGVGFGGTCLGAGALVIGYNKRRMKKEIEALENTPTPSILSVGYEDRVKDSYCRYFSLLGYDIMTAEDGKAGLEMALSTPPDLIITCNRMPEMTGYEMATALKSDPNTKDIPILGYGDFSLEEQRILDHYIPKTDTQLKGLYDKVKEIFEGGST